MIDLEPVGGGDLELSDSDYLESVTLTVEHELHDLMDHNLQRITMPGLIRRDDPMYGRLRALTLTGFYGGSVNETAERLLAELLRQEEQPGGGPWPPWSPNDE